jgi:AraC-like DNA-binding protein
VKLAARGTHDSEVLGRVESSDKELDVPAARVLNQRQALGWSSFSRLPRTIPFLSHLIQHEIVYRILRTPQGERLPAIATTGDLSHRATRAIAWLRANIAKPLHMEELAEIARMGVSTLHHQFRALTA